MSSTPLAFAPRGPHPVGLATVELADNASPGRSLPTDIWYPAAADTDPAEQPPAQHPLARPHAAVPNAAAAAGRPFPLVAFSHGNSGLRRQSTFLTTHLASWGMVVVAPDHTGNTFFEMIQIRSEDERQRVHFEARHNRPRDLQTAIDTVVAGGGAWPAVDANRIGVAGHSYGGWTAFKMPGCDSRVRAVCGLAPASEPFVGRKAFGAGELPLPPGIASLIIAGRDDVLVDLETSVRPLFARLSEPRDLLVVNEADHFHFCDGIELLHGMHVGNPRPNQPRPTKPWGEVLDEERTHRVLRALVTSFFADTFGEADARAPSVDALRQLDRAVARERADDVAREESHRDGAAA